MRGAPAIGVAAAYGVVLGVRSGAAFDDVCELLAATRPTAVNLRWAIDRAGGEQRLKGCGQVFTGIFQVPSVAWYLHLHIRDVGVFPHGRGTALATRHSPLSVDPRYPTFAETNKWLIGSSCERR